MSPPPIPMIFSNDVFRPLPNFLRIAREHYGEGEIVSMLPHEERSRASHSHYFACVTEAWKNLPEHLTERYPSAEALRKHALIQTGHHDAEHFVCKFKTEAVRLAAALNSKADYSLVIIDGKIVTRLTAKSQNLQSMGKEAFAKSKDDVLSYLADLVGVTQAELSQARAA